MTERIRIEAAGSTPILIVENPTDTTRELAQRLVDTVKGRINNDARPNEMWVTFAHPHRDTNAAARILRRGSWDGPAQPKPRDPWTCSRCGGPTSVKGKPCGEC